MVCIELRNIATSADNMKDTSSHHDVTTGHGWPSVAILNDMSENAR